MGILVNGRPIDYDADSLIPQHMRDGMKLYMENKILPGSFLTAVLENDLMGALSRADDVNIARLHDYGRWLYNYAPPGSYGGREAVTDWIDNGEKQ